MTVARHEVLDWLGGVELYERGQRLAIADAILASGSADETELSSAGLW